jgi:hypothetical protein
MVKLPSTRWRAQEHINGCAVACVAMVLGVSYADALADFRERIDGRSFHNDGIPESLLDLWLGLHGFAVLRRYRNESDPEWRKPFAPIHVCSVSSPTGWHVVVLTGEGELWDPADATRDSLDQYDRVENVAGLWRVMKGERQ